VPLPSQESEWSYIYVLGVLIFPLSAILMFYFGTVLTVSHFILLKYLDNPEHASNYKINMYMYTPKNAT